MAVENTKTPTALIFSRQKIKDLPESTPYEMATRGGYIVYDDPKTDIILLASGSEVSTLAEAAELLRADGVGVRLVSVPSEGLFRNQTKEYQDAVLTPGIPKFGLTAGLTVNLESLVGNDGCVFGVNHFGYSAPYTVLDEKFGFTPQSVYENIKTFLSDRA